VEISQEGLGGFLATSPLLDERQRRPHAAAMVDELGRDGQARVAEVTGMSRNTLLTGAREHPFSSLPVETLGAHEEELADLEQRAILTAAVSELLVLDPTADGIDSPVGDPRHVERIRDMPGVGEVWGQPERYVSVKSRATTLTPAGQLFGCVEHHFRRRALDFPSNRSTPGGGPSRPCRWRRWPGAPG